MRFRRTRALPHRVGCLAPPIYLPHSARSRHFRRSAPLLDSIVLSDAGLAKAQEKMNAAASKVTLSWVSPEMAFHAAASTGLAAFVYISHSVIAFPVSSGVFLTVHMLLGVVLGIMLVVRIVLGYNRTVEASKQVQDFNKSCRQLAVLATFVGETLTVSAGAEIEKKATQNFKYEVVRLLNMASYCFQLMLNGMKLVMPPSSLKAEGSSNESQILSAVENPTVMVCKMMASLLEQQRAAKRISNEQTGVLTSKITDLIDTYHNALALMLAPTPTAFSSLTFFFTLAFAYTVGPVIAINELGDNAQFASFGLMLTVSYTCVLSLFFFGLHEAGKTIEVPAAAAPRMPSLPTSSYSDRPVAVGRWQLAGGSWPVAVGRWQLAGGSWPVATRRHVAHASTSLVSLACTLTRALAR